MKLNKEAGSEAESFRESLKAKLTNPIRNDSLLVADYLIAIMHGNSTVLKAFPCLPRRDPFQYDILI